MCKLFKQNAKSITENKEPEIQQVQKETEEEIGKWEWIEGYKGTNINMQGYEDFQFELNTEYTQEGKIVLCENGFHFCETLRDTLNYNNLLDSRFFKVKALVNMTEMKQQKQLIKSKNSYSFYTPNLNKFAAKKIILTEEVSFDELFPYIKNHYYYVETEQDWQKLKKVGYEQYKRDYFFEKMKDSIFGETFLCILYDKIKENGLYIEKTIKFSQALKEENISKDMATYLILKHVKGE